MWWGMAILVVLGEFGSAMAQTPSEEGVGGRYLRVCATELQQRNLPAAVGDCERLLERSHLVQSDAIRYLAHGSDDDRQRFGAAPTLGRYEILESDVDPSLLMSFFLNEKGSAASGLAVQLAKDVMKPGCGFYQIDAILRTLEGIDALPPSPRSASRKPRHPAYKSCLAGVAPDGNVASCLNPIFLPLTSEPSPNP